MENQKGGKGKNIVIAILVLLVIGLGGYITYNEINKGKESDALVQKYKDDNETLKNEVEKLKNKKTTTASNPLEALVGTWINQDSFNLDDSVPCNINIKLDIKDDGTYTYENSSTCGGGTRAKGTYALGKEEIYLHNENCNPVVDFVDRNNCTYPNCNPIIKISYKNGKLAAEAVGGRVANLELNKN